MKTKDNKKVVYYCETCSRVKPFDEWQILNDEAKKQIQEQRQNSCVKFIKSVCPECIKK